MEDNIILNHYHKVAKNFGDSPLSSIQDPVIRDQEISFFIKEIDRFIEKEDRFPRILEVGCGNGHLLSVMSKKYPQSEICAFEFTPELFQIAFDRKLPNVTVVNADARLEFPFTGTFDIIITERVIINLLKWEWQHTALTSISNRLNTGGLYLMAESFHEPWMELNKARREMVLEEIPVSNHNRYLKEMVVNYLHDLGLSEIEALTPKNQLSTHFFNSRILHSALRVQGAKLKNSMFVQFFDLALPPAILNISPILFRAFQKYK